MTKISSWIRSCVVEAGRESSAANEFCGPGDLLDGDCWKCCLLYGDTQEHLWNRILRRSDVDDHGANGDSASTRTTSLFEAQVASRIQMSEALRVIGNLAAAQVRKNTPSLIDVNGLGHPKEFFLARRRRTSNIVRSRRKHSSLE